MERLNGALSSGAAEEVPASILQQGEEIVERAPRARADSATRFVAAETPGVEEIRNLLGRERHVDAFGENIVEVHEFWRA